MTTDARSKNPANYLHFASRNILLLTTPEVLSSHLLSIDILITSLNAQKDKWLNIVAKQGNA